MDDEFKNSTLIVLLDQRDEEIVGFDLISLPEANRVAGIWNLTVGAHFMYIKEKNEDAIRRGEFVYFKRGEVKVFKRAKDDNGQVFKYIEEYSNNNYKESIIMDHLRNKMSRVPQNLSHLWSNITDCINLELIERLRPINKVIKNRTFNVQDPEFFTRFDNLNYSELRNATIRSDLINEDEEKTLEEYKQIANNLSQFPKKLDLNALRKDDSLTDKSKPCGIDETVEEDYNCIYYSDIPMCDGRIKTFSKISPGMLTAMHMDTSFVLESIVKMLENNHSGYGCKEFHNKYLYVLGELQYSFLLFLLCFNFESFQQYKKLLKAFCNAESVLISNQQLSNKFLNTLRYHIEIWDEEQDIYQQDNFLTNSLFNLKEIIVDNKHEMTHCLENFRDLEKSFKLKFGISLDDLETIHTNIV